MNHKVSREEINMLSRLGANKSLLTSLQILRALESANDQPLKTDVLRQRLTSCASTRSLQRSLARLSSMGLCQRRNDGWVMSRKRER